MNREPKNLNPMLQNLRVGGGGGGGTSMDEGGRWEGPEDTRGEARAVCPAPGPKPGGAEGLGFRV